jgi:hypothetical protein
MLTRIKQCAGEDARTTAGQETGGTGFSAIFRAGVIAEIQKQNANDRA